jgi:hypothetical protein
MDLEPQTVAEGVAEGVSEAASRNDIPGQRIAFSGRHPWAQVLDGPALGGLHQLVYGTLPVVCSSAHHYRASKVGAVSVDLSAKVE